MNTEQTTWPIVKLGKLIIDMQPGFAQRPHPNEDGIPQLRPNNISNWGNIDLSEIKYVRPSKTELEKYFVSRGDVIFNNTNSPDLVGRTAYFDLDTQFVLSNHMTRLRVMPELVEAQYLARYLYYLWKIKASRRWTKQWVNQAAIDQKDLAKIPIPLPPLPEQRRTVAILRKADELRQLRRQSFNSLHQLFLSQLNKLLENATRQVRFSKVVEIRTETASHSEKQTLPYVGLENIEQQTGFLVEHFEEKTISSNSTNFIFTEQDVLLSKLRPNLNKVLLPSFSGVCTTELLPLRPKNADISREFLWAYLLSPDFVHWAIQRTQGAQLPRLSPSLLKSKVIPLPERSQQERFSGFIKALIAQRRHLQQSLRHIETLYFSLLARAFTGELTAAWREAHATELAEAAAERDQLLGIKPPLGIPEQLDLATEEGQEAFAEELKRVVPSIATQLAANMGSTTALAESLQQGLTAAFSKQLEEAVAQNATFVDSALTQVIQDLGEDIQRSLAVSLQPLQEAMKEAVSPIQTVSLKWAADIAQIATLVLRRPDVSHPRYAVLRAISDSQYLTYLAVRSVGEYVTVETLADETLVNGKMLEQDLELLAASGLIQAVSVPTQPAGDQIVYVQAYRMVTDADDSRGDDLTMLKELAS